MLWFKFLLGLNFSLFLAMVMYDNESETMGKELKPRRKLNRNISTSLALKDLLLKMTAFLVLAKNK